MGAFSLAAPPECGALFGFGKKPKKEASTEGLPGVKPERQVQPAADAQMRARLGPAAIKVLYSAMEHEDPEIRSLAAQEWSRIGNPAARGVLEGALKDKNAYVRIAAAGGLMAMGDAKGVKDVESIVSRAPKLPGGTTRLAPVDEMRFITLNKVRVTAARSLGRMGAASSRDVLEKALGDDVGAVRDAAAAALARMGEPVDLQDFVFALGSEDPSVRQQAVRALGEAGLKDKVPLLAPLASDKEYPVRAEVMEALGKIGAEEALGALTKGATDQNELVRAKAIEALGLVGSREAVPTLQTARKTAGNVYVELLAISALARLGVEVGAGEAQRAVNQKDPDARILAVGTLEHIGGTAALENLETCLTDPEMKVRVRAAASLLKLLTEKR
ncbi:MAG: HEAT repeat domain-containing protein [Elusimicrobiota bacterium]